jgi:hypothetical protein
MVKGVNEMNRRTYFLVTMMLIFASFILGCSGGGSSSGSAFGSGDGMTYEQWKVIIKPGMTEAEVIAVVGREPDGHGPIIGISHAGKIDVWKFGHGEGYVGFYSTGKVDMIGWGNT